MLLHARRDPVHGTTRRLFWFAFWVLVTIAVISAGDLQARACDELSVAGARSAGRKRELVLVPAD
jgi:hypothetical protein